MLLSRLIASTFFCLDILLPDQVTTPFADHLGEKDIHFHEM